jgi:hypothetical protein
VYGYAPERYLQCLCCGSSSGCCKKPNPNELQKNELPKDMMKDMMIDTRMEEKKKAKYTRKDSPTRRPQSQQEHSSCRAHSHSKWCMKTRESVYYKMRTASKKRSVSR